VAGAGTVLATAGQGGRSLNKQDPTKAVAGYFQSYMGSNNNPTYGFLKVDLTPTTLTGTFVRGAGGTYTDSFTITRPATTSASPSSTATTATTSSTASPSASTSASSSPAPSPSLTLSPSPSSSTSTGLTFDPVADSWVGSDLPTATHGGDKALYSDTSPTKVTYLKYDLSPLAGRTVVSASLQVTTTSSAYSGSPDTQRVHPVADSSWTEGALNYANRPAPGTDVLGSLAGSSGATTYNIPLRSDAIQAGAGSLLSLAIDSSGGDAFYIGSRESAAPPRLVVTTD
jgi:hypothetical protein